MVAFIFPGQGVQYVGMAKDLYETFVESRDIFDMADKLLNFPLSKLCFKGPIAELTQTVHCQPAIFTTSLATLAAFNKLITKNRQLVPGYMAGLSLGEYTALVAAEALSFEDGLYLVAQRARLMEEVAVGKPGKMSSILGLNSDMIEKIVQETGVEIANLNCPGQIVISGSIEVVNKASELALAYGAKRVVDLEVSGAFHSSLMQPARERLAVVLDNINIKETKIGVISNVTASVEYNPAQIKDNLILQLTSSVLWEKSVRFMIEQGVNKFFEIGPGRVLRGLIRKIAPAVEVVNIEKKEDIMLRCQGL